MNKSALSSVTCCTIITLWMVIIVEVATEDAKTLSYILNVTIWKCNKCINFQTLCDINIKAIDIFEIHLYFTYINILP